MRKWVESTACATRVHCVACRSDSAWRESLRAAGMVETADFDCPDGITAETAPAIQAQAIAKLPGAADSEEQKVKMEEQGRTAWGWLHSAAEKDALTPERLEKEFEPMIPAYGCQCVNSWRQDLARHSLPELGQARWAIGQHNITNKKLGKPLWLNPLE